MAKNEVLILDGKKYTRGPIEKGIGQAKIFTHPRRGQPGNTILGFTSQKLFEEWTKKEGLLDRYKRGRQTIGNTRRHIKPGLPARKQEEIRQLQVKMVKSANRQFAEVLKKHGILPHEIKKIGSLRENYDYFRGPVINSALFFIGVRHTGNLIYLPSGWAYPDLRWFGFDNRISSGIAWWPGTVILFENTWFGGRPFWLWGSRGFLGWFDNRASSAIATLF
jgi:hypothetical protein